MDKRIVKIREEYDIDDSAKSLILDIMNLALINREYEMVIKCFSELNLDLKTTRINEGMKECVVTALGILEDVKGDVEALEGASDNANNACIEILNAIIILKGGLNA